MVTRSSWLIGLSGWWSQGTAPSRTEPSATKLSKR